MPEITWGKISCNDKYTFLNPIAESKKSVLRITKTYSFDDHTEILELIHSNKINKTRINIKNPTPLNPHQLFIKEQQKN